MREKKFMYYKVVAEYDNGTEEVLSEDTQYKNILSNYRVAKNEYKDKQCKIACIGIGKYNNSSVLWEKNYITKDTVSLEVVEKNINAIKELLSNINIPNNDMEGVFSKKQDIILHKIETVESSDLTEAELQTEKLKLVNELIEVRNERRDMKDMNELIKQINSIGRNLKPIQENIESIRAKRNRFQSYNKINNSKIHNMQELTYRNDKQKENIYNLFTTMYNKVVIDEVNQKVVGYNKCYNKYNKYIK